MKAVIRLGCAACLVSAAACGRADTSKASTGAAPPAVAPAALVEVKGCVTASDGQFVLTDLDPAVPSSGKKSSGEAARPTTDAYRLLGMHDALVGLAGQRVDVAGTAAPERVTDLRELSPPEEPRNGDSTGTAGSGPAVTTSESAHIVVHDLRVESVESLGEACNAGKR
jgi:hypothetical protein